MIGMLLSENAITMQIVEMFDSTDDWRQTIKSRFYWDC